MHNSSIPTFFGQLIDENGNGVPNVLVALYKNGSFTGLTAITNSTGYYAISWIINETGTFEFQTKAEITESPIISLFEHQDSGNEWYAVYDGNSFSSWIAQTFTPRETHQLTKVVLKLSRVGASQGYANLSILLTSGNKPTGSYLASKLIDSSNIPTDSFVEVTFTFDTQITLDAGTMYAIVLRYPGDGSNYIKWQTTNSDVYSGGTLLDSSNWGASWTIRSTDCYFSEWGVY